MSPEDMNEVEQCPEPRCGCDCHNPQWVFECSQSDCGNWMADRG